MIRLGTNTMGRPVTLNDDALCEHVLLIGSTGSGKTEMLLAMAAEQVARGGGLLVMDGKGEPGTWERLAGIADALGRGEDLRLLDFSHGGRGNTLLPLATMSADRLLALLVQMMEETQADGAMWKGRAISLLGGVVRAACHLRDNYGEEMDAQILVKELSLVRIIQRSKDTRLTPSLTSGLRSYLMMLPGYSEGKGTQQSQNTLDQHGYLHMQFLRVLDTLGDANPHVFGGENPIDARDLLRGRRICMVRLPALEKSPDEILNLGRIVIALLRDVMIRQFEGDEEPRRGGPPMPFLVMLDEAGSYLAEGVTEMIAQARSLRMAIVVSTQSVESLERWSERAARSVMSNTNTKVVMRSAPGQIAMHPRAPNLPTGDFVMLSRGKDIVGRVRRTEALPATQCRRTNGLVSVGLDFLAECVGTLRIDPVSLLGESAVGLPWPFEKSVTDERDGTRGAKRAVALLSNLSSQNKGYMKRTDDVVRLV